MFEAHLPSHLWADSILTATYLINRMPSKTTHHKSPYQILHRHKPDYQHLRVFGCACYPILPAHSRHKLQPHTIQCVFLGYPSDAKGYKCLHPPTGRIYTSRHIIFDEQTFPYLTISNNPNPTSPQQQDLTTNPLLLTPTTTVPFQTLTIPPNTVTNPASTSPTQNSSDIPYPRSNSPPSTTSNSALPYDSPIHPPQHSMLTRTRTGSLKPRAIFDLQHLSSSTDTPTSFSQASKSTPWRQAMSQEFTTLQHQGT